MSEPVKALVSALKDRQGTQSDPAFAQALRISHMHWWRVKHGRRGIGRDFGSKIISRYPDLWRLVQDVAMPRRDEGAA